MFKIDAEVTIEGNAVDIINNLERLEGGKLAKGLKIYIYLKYPNEHFTRCYTLGLANKEQIDSAISQIRKFQCVHAISTAYAEEIERVIGEFKKHIRFKD